MTLYFRSSRFTSFYEFTDSTLNSCNDMRLCNIYKNSSVLCGAGLNNCFFASGFLSFLSLSPRCPQMIAAFQTIWLQKKMGEFQVRFKLLNINQAPTKSSSFSFALNILLWPRPHESVFVWKRNSIFHFCLLSTHIQWKLNFLKTPFSWYVWTAWNQSEFTECWKSLKRKQYKYNRTIIEHPAKLTVKLVQTLHRCACAII